MDHQEHIHNLREQEADWESSQQELVAKNYFKNLDLTPEELQDKKILDIGSGSQSDFANYLSGHHISNEVVSIDPFATENDRRDKTIKALGEKLPFQDESFDFVVSNNAVPSIYYTYPSTIEMKRRVGESLQEMVRITKEGGEIRFYPVYKGGEGTFFETVFEYLESLLKDLEKKGEYEISVSEKEKFEMYHRELTALLIRIKKLPKNKH